MDPSKLSGQLKLFTYNRTHNYDQYLPENWSKAARWHASESQTFPNKDWAENDVFDEADEGTVDPKGFHLGTSGQAAFRADWDDYPDTPTSKSNPDTRKYLHPVAVSSPRGTVSMDDMSANTTVAARRAIDAGKNVVYKNTAELTPGDSEEPSIRAPRGNIKTWRESVLSDPKAHPHWKRLAEEGHDLVYERTPVEVHEQLVLPTMGNYAQYNPDYGGEPEPFDVVKTLSDTSPAHTISPKYLRREWGSEELGTRSAAFHAAFHAALKR